MQQSALRSFAIVCDYMKTTLFTIVCDLRSAIRVRLRSYGNQPLPLRNIQKRVLSQENLSLQSKLLLFALRIKQGNIINWKI